MSIEFDDKQTNFSQTELVLPIQSSLINPSMSLVDVLDAAQSSPTSFPDTTTTTPTISDDAGVKILANGKYQSPNFSTGITGWNIDSDGSVEFNNGTFRGTFILGGVIITVNNVNNIQSAINSVAAQGGGIVNLEPGTYYATTSFTLPSNVSFDLNGAVIDFGGTANNISAIGTNAYSTGTLSANFGSGSVTGSGTTWTAAMIGRSILIGDYWYEITGRSSNTAITISPVFRAPNVSGATYVIATTIDNIGLGNGTLQNNITNPLFDFRYINGLVMDGLTTSISPQGIRGRDSANVQWLNSETDNCTAGVLFNNVVFCTLNNFAVIDITGGTALDITGMSNSSIGIMAIQNIVGTGVSFTNCKNTGLLNYSIIECTAKGMEFVSGNSDMDFDSGYINTCGSDGVKLTASSNRIQITTTNISNTTGYQVNIADSSNNNNIILGNTFDGGGSGAVQNLGTSTIIKSNQGVADFPTLLNIPFQILPILASTSAVYAATYFTSEPDGSVLYSVSQNSASNGANISRYVRDAITGQFYMTHQINTTDMGTSQDFSIAVTANNLWVFGKSAGSGVAWQFSKADLTGETSVTISGTKFASGRSAFSDGTNLYVLETTSQYRKYSVSGTTITNVSTITYTSAGAVGVQAICDGTSVWTFEGNLSNSSFPIRKYALAGGAATATKDTFPVNPYVTQGTTSLIIAKTGILAFMCPYNIDSATAITGSAANLSPISAP